jgi:hypothetical protein
MFEYLLPSSGGTMRHASSIELQQVAVRNNWPRTSKSFSSADWPPSGETISA